MQAMETLDTDELVPEALRARSPIPAMPRTPRARSHPATPRKVVEEQWCSTLGPQDLRCLLNILEEQVLPQMLRAYAPALCAAERLPEPGA